MTYREWITKTVSRFGASEDDVELILANQLDAIGGDPDAEVSVRKATIALCNEFATFLPMANISEGGYSLTWNMDAVKWWYELMCDKYDITPVGTKPKLRFIDC